MPDVFVGIVCPALGNVLGVTMLLAPAPAVVQLYRTQKIGAMNPLPFALTLLCSIGWVAYGLVIPNLWMLIPNVIGTCLGIWYTQVALPLLDRKGQDRMLGLLICSAAFFCILAICGVYLLEEETRVQMWGIVALVGLMTYYAVPLSTMWEVIKTRNGVSIYLPLAIAALANATMWTLYGGLGIHDFNVWMPNIVGIILALLQLLLRLVFGAREPHQADSHLQTMEGMAPAEATSRSPTRTLARNISDHRVLLLEPQASLSDCNLPTTNQPLQTTRVELHDFKHDASGVHHRATGGHHDVVDVDGLPVDASAHMIVHVANATSGVSKP